MSTYPDEDFIDFCPGEDPIFQDLDWGYSEYNKQKFNELSSNILLLFNVDIEEEDSLLNLYESHGFKVEQTVEGICFMYCI